MLKRSETLLDTLRLSPRQVEELLDTLQQRESVRSPEQSRRNSERYFFTELSGVPLETSHPGGSGARFSVIPTDLSETGLGVLHGGFLHENTPVTVTLTDTRGQSRHLVGRVRRCILHAGRVHVIGIQFEEPIKLADYMRSEDRIPQSIHGSVLHIDDSADFRLIFKHHCSKIGVDVTEAADGDAAVAAVQAGEFGLAFVDLHLESSDGLEAVMALRCSGFQGPVVLLTGDESADVKARAEAAGVAQVMIKPVMPDMIRTALARHLGQGEGDEAAPIMSAFWSDAEMRPFIEGMARQLSARVADVTRRFRASDAGWRDACRDLKSEAGICGYAELAEQFRRIEAGDDTSPRSIEDGLRDVERMVYRVQAGLQVA